MRGVSWLPNSFTALWIKKDEKDPPLRGGGPKPLVRSVSADRYK